MYIKHIYQNVYVCIVHIDMCICTYAYTQRESLKVEIPEEYSQKQSANQQYSMFKFVGMPNELV